jgi:hypothetical protein
VQVGKGFAKVVDECLLTLTLHDNVVDVFLDVAPDLDVEAFPHSSLKGRSYILEPEGYTSIAEAPYRHNKCLLLLILNCYLDLEVTRERIKKAQKVTSCHGVHDLINAWQWKRILRAGLVEIREIDAHPHSPIGLWDHQGVCLPRGVHHFSDHLGLLQLPHFLDDEVLAILTLAPHLLLDRACHMAHR